MAFIVPTSCVRFARYCGTVAILFGKANYIFLFEKKPKIILTFIIFKNVFALSFFSLSCESLNQFMIRS